MYIAIAGTEGRALSGIEESVDLKMKTPGKKENDYCA